MKVAGLDKTDPTFVDDLRRSQRWPVVIAHWFQKRGFDVIIRGQRIRPSADERFAFADGGDLHVLQRIEVKHRPDIDFDSVESFPYDEIIVDVAHSWDKARPKPFAYFIVNASGTGAFIVYGRFEREWRRGRCFDNHAGREREFLYCPMRLVKYVKLQDGRKDGR